jgi:hypothetical protein
MSDFRVAPLVKGASGPEIKAILGAMRAIAETSGKASDADPLAIASAGQYMFGERAFIPFASLRSVAPPALSSALNASAVAEDAVKFLTIMAFIDGRLDKAKIANVLKFATVLGIHQRYLDEIAEAAQGHIQDALADMTRANTLSIAGPSWTGGDVTKWLMPYADKPDPSLAQRFEALGKLGANTFGHAYWQHFKANGYDFPGVAQRLERYLRHAPRHGPCGLSL